MILAGIDIGTNTFRLLIAETRTDSFQELYSDRIITRLGQDLDKTGLISDEAGERSLKALERFANAIQRHGVVGSAAVGTSALRMAGNAATFLEVMQRKTGISVNVISGEEEARLTLLGVIWALKDRGTGHDDSHDPKYVIDIGGGSTEIITLKEGKILDLTSMTMGAVYLTERFIQNDPPSSEECVQLRQLVKETLKGCGSIDRRACSCIGTAGTITTLAAMDLKLSQYDPDAINGHVLTRNAIDAFVHELATKTLTERRAITGLEKGREDIIYAGAVILQEVMDRIGCDSMMVSDGGLREGIVIDLYERMSKTNKQGT